MKTDRGQRLVVAATFIDHNFANIALARLDAHGIRAVLDGEHHVAMDWLISNAIGGVKLLVMDNDLNRAKQILQETSPEIDPNITGDSKMDSALDACPLCGSSDIFRQRLDRKLVFISILLLGIPVPFLKRRRHCARCHHQW